MSRKKLNDYEDVIEYRAKLYKPKHKPLMAYKLWRYYRYRIFIIMFKTNGTIDLTYVFHNKEKFVYEGGVYIIDKDYVRWSDGLSSMVGVYFQSVSLPIDLAFNEKDTIDAIKHKIKASRVDANVNPYVLESTVNSEVIQKLMRGEELESLLQRIFLLCAIGTVLTVLLVLGFLFMFMG